MPVLWSLSLARPRLEILGDINLVVNWVNGLWRCKFRIYDQRLAMLHTILQDLAANFGLRPRLDDAEWSRHVFRELNKDADALATSHVDSYTEHCHDTEFLHFRIFFDGSCSSSGSGGGWVLYGTPGAKTDAPEEWLRISELSFPLQKGATVTAAEFEACLSSLAYFRAWMQGPSATKRHVQTWKPLDTSRFGLLELSGLIF
jgi:ribonuclease HI